MTGPEHYREAQRLLGEVSSGFPYGSPEGDSVYREAQAHATLALVAIQVAAFSESLPEWAAAVTAQPANA